MASIKEVYERALKVIDSCESVTFLHCTENYVHLSVRKLEFMGCRTLDLHWNGKLLQDINDKIYHLQKRIKEKKLEF